MGVFRFSTVRLDVRENSMRINPTLAELFRLNHGGADPPRRVGGMETLAAIRARYAARCDSAPTNGLPQAAADTLATFRTIARLRAEIDREAFGALILSMTRSAADILGVYLMAKEGGLFPDTAAIERCPVPIVPLLETIPDLRRAPAILKELLAVPLVQRSLTFRARFRR